MNYASLAGLAGALCIGLVPVAASAAIQLGINGDAQVGSNYLDFGQYPNGAPYTPAPGYGTFEISLVNSGVFSSNGVTTGEFGNIQSLNEGPGPVSLPGPFITFDTGGSNLQLWATNIPAGNYGAYTLFDTPNGAVGSISVDGYVTNGGAKLGDFTMTASATFDGETVAQLLSTALPINTPFSATFTFTAVPEPGTWAMMLVGFGVAGAALRSARRTRSFA
jgi:hypothetical protein